FIYSLNSILYSMLVQFNSEEPHDALVTFKCQFQLGYDITLCFKLKQLIKTSGLLLNRICELFQTPVFLINYRGSVVFQQSLEFVDCLLCLVSRQNGSHNENSLIMITHCILVYLILLPKIGATKIQIFSQLFIGLGN